MADVLAVRDEYRAQRWAMAISLKISALAIFDKIQQISEFCLHLYSPLLRYS